MTLGDTMVYQELLYRIQVLETCQMLCKTAPVTTDTGNWFATTSWWTLYCSAPGGSMPLVSRPGAGQGPAKGRWGKSGQDCGRLPETVLQLPGEKPGAGTGRVFPPWSARFWWPGCSCATPTSPSERRQSRNEQGRTIPKALRDQSGGGFRPRRLRGGVYGHEHRRGPQAPPCDDPDGLVPFEIPGGPDCGRSDTCQGLFRGESPGLSQL